MPRFRDHFHPMRVFIGIIACWSVGLSQPALASPPDFVRDVRPIFEKYCYACHGEAKQKSGVRFDVKSAALRGGDGYGASIVPGDPEGSPLLEFVQSREPDHRMPPDGLGLDEREIAILREWIQAGATWPDGVDHVTLLNPRDHWAFQPLGTFEGKHSIDVWIEKSLSERGLSLSPPADRLEWLRRVTLDLHGLPPSADQMQRLVDPSSEKVLEEIVDELLASPRYGERWAQHWLDVVRYADTHGFEVNTERPHAWHYRDYVIQALNDDLPYDQFIREQIVGDQLDRDAATGFLITASVLLPGQIGADEPSKRLARQDAIDEIVINLGQSFLGMTIGCARCHDHKFDPVSQRDYYAMQAFVAGVEYGDRIVNTPEAKQMRREVVSITERIEAIDHELSRLEPLANSHAKERTAVDPQENDERFESVLAKWVRFEIFDANLHPSLGKLEPCIDEIEIWSDDSSPINVALSSYGARATASGSTESEIHRLAHINDGIYGNEHSWMSNEIGKGWVLLELPQPARISRIVWGRDRLGRFRDRTPSAYRITAGDSVENMHELFSVGVKRTAVNAKRNIDRIPPQWAKRLRMTIQATNQLEPCIDELEVFDTDGRNVALATLGTTVSSSGDQITPDRHELPFVNDGKYGNSRSWMSNEVGKGTLIFEFPSQVLIDRIVWGRDRESQFRDRLATEYTIELAGVDGVWTTVASSADRHPFRADDRSVNAEPVSRFGLTSEDTALADRLLLELKELESQRTSAIEAQKAFAGIFRQPDEIHLLYRGDPEQRRERVPPQIPSFFGSLEVPEPCAEADRRRALANWIASPENPLTARVMVNRIWQGHFGTGIVATPNDFGMHGAPPSHPELLDWLAGVWWNESRWSIKWLHKQIVLSQVYRQSSTIRPDALSIDADVRWLWRYPRRRLESEAIRDTILSVSGQLRLNMFGRGFNLFDQRGGLSGFRPVESYREDGLRRMIYAHKVRREREAIFGAFDCPDAGQSTATRRVSTTPIQALNLFNSQFTLDQSDAFSQRIRSLEGEDLVSQIQTAYWLALTRKATQEEVAQALPIVRDHGLPTLCRALFNCSEFLFYP